MPLISKFETWVCRRTETPMRLPGERRPFGAEVVLLRLTTDDGIEGYATSMAPFTPDIALAYLNEVIAPVVIGRDVYDREAIWHDLYVLNRRFAFFPNYLPGPVDVALWDIAAKAAGLPLYKYLGAYRDRIPAYASSQFMNGVDDYLREARRYRDLGVKAYKAHPSGDWREHIEISEALRSEFPDLVLMLDPALSDYSLTHAVAVGRKLEELGFYWLEEPFHDQFVGKYVELCRTLDISILSGEAATGGPAGVAEFVRSGGADIVRADPSWKWGITGTLKVQHMAEAFGLNCELHTTTMGLMDAAVLHLCCAARNCEYFELFAPHEAWQFPLAKPLELDSEGFVHAPTAPGLGVEIDWDTVDDTTLAHQEAAS